MSNLRGNRLAPVSAKMLPRTDQEYHARSSQIDADTTYHGIYRGEIQEAEYRQRRNQECGDDGRQETKANRLPKMIMYLSTQPLTDHAGTQHLFPKRISPQWWKRNGIRYRKKVMEGDDRASVGVLRPTGLLS